jgi:hypothetical protein
MGLLSTPALGKNLLPLSFSPSLPLSLPSRSFSFVLFLSFSLIIKSFEPSPSPSLHRVLQRGLPVGERILGHTTVSCFAGFTNPDPSSKCLVYPWKPTCTEWQHGN